MMTKEGECLCVFGYIEQGDVSSPEEENALRHPSGVSICMHFPYSIEGLFSELPRLETKGG